MKSKLSTLRRIPNRLRVSLNLHTRVPFLKRLLLVVLVVQAAYCPAARAGAQLELLIENLTGYPVDVVSGGEGNSAGSKQVTIENGAILAQPVTEGGTWSFRVLKDKIIGQYTASGNAKQRVVLDQAALDAVGIPAPPEKSDAGGGTVLPAEPQPAKFVDSPNKPREPPPKIEVNGSPAPAKDAGPPRGALVNWFDSDPEACAIVTKDQKFFNVDDNGGVGLTTSSKGKEAKSTATFLFKEVPGKEKTYRIQNTYYLDSFLYLAADAKEGSPLRCGPEGASSPNGEWKVVKGQYYNSLISIAKPALRIGVRGNSVGLSAKTYDDVEPKEMADTYANNAGDAFFLFDVKSMRKLLGMAPVFQQMATNIENLQNERKAEVAGVEQRKKEAEAREAQRRKILREPEIAGGGFGSDAVTVRLGVGDVFETKEGYKAIKYTYTARGPKPYLVIDLHTSQKPEENQYLELQMEPKVVAWVQDGELYVGIDTDKSTSLNLRHGKQPSSSKATDGNWYIGNVRINQMWPIGREVIMFPTVENKEVSLGFSSDLSKGLNLSAEELLSADISESSGRNVSFQTREYEISGERGPGESFVGSTQYQWEATGISDKPKTTSNRTYEAPIDLWDKETLSLRKIPKIAQALSGLETRSVFGNHIPASGLQSQPMMNFDVHVQLHMVKLVHSTRENTKNKDWEDFKAGFTYIFRPDLWDLNKSFEDQHIIKESQFKPVGFTYDVAFRTWLFVPIDDLKPFMKK